MFVPAKRCTLRRAQTERRKVARFKISAWWSRPGGGDRLTITHRDGVVAREKEIELMIRNPNLVRFECEPVEERTET